MPPRAGRSSSPDQRVAPVTLDVTDRAQIQDAVDSVESLDILINNAGVSVPDDLSDRSAFERHLAVNLYGTLDVTRAFLPVADAQPRRRGQRRVARRGSRGAGPPGLFGLQGGRAFGHPVAARAAGWPGRERSRRHCPVRSTPTWCGRSTSRRRRPRTWRGPRWTASSAVEEEIFPDPMSQSFARRLARGRGEGARAPERGAGPDRADRGVTADRNHGHDDDHPHGRLA